MLKRSYIVFLLVIAALAAPSSAFAGDVFSLSDANETFSASQIAQQLSYSENQYCAFKAPKPRHLSLKKALRHVNSYIGEHTSSRAQRKFTRSNAGATERNAIAAAAAAVAAKKPEAAILALVRAHKMKPRDPMPLINASALLVDAKLPNEALSFLAAAAKLRQPGHMPMGISSKALIANNRGFALLALRKWGDADKQLQAAVDQAPLLAEAKDNLANALLCQKKTQSAAKMIFFAAHRDPRIGLDLVDSSVGVPTPTESGVDVSHGAKIRLPVYTYPSTIAKGAGMVQTVRDERDRIEQKESALINRSNSLQSRLQTELQSKPVVTRRRVNSLVAVAVWAHDDPSLSSLADKVSEDEDAINQIEGTYFGQAPNCAGAAVHTQWVNAIETYDSDLRAFIKADYGLGTSVGANVSDPVAHALIMANAGEDAQVRWVYLLQQTEMLTMWDQACNTTMPPAGDVVKDPTDKMAASPKCPSGLQGKGFQLTILIVQVSVDCENVGLEVDTGGWIGAFGNVSHNFRDGSTTVFAGPRFKANPGPWGPNVNFKDGLYMKFGSDGQVQDLGGRVETGSEINAGPVGATFSGDSMNFSLAGSSPIGSTAQLYR